jgi:hypothetical protein
MVWSFEEVPEQGTVLLKQILCEYLPSNNAAWNIPSIFWIRTLWLREVH